MRDKVKKTAFEEFISLKINTTKKVIKVETVWLVMRD
jgi:hypothetical protein